MVQTKVMLSEKEVDRLAVINRVREGRSTQALAAQQLGLSVRQVKRLCRTVRVEGAAALAQPTRAPKIARERCGELVQIDGSHHDWFEGRAERCCLIAFIDDASGQVLAARFFAGETTACDKILVAYLSHSLHHSRP